MITFPITRSDDHRYFYEGRQYPGVTSILDLIDKSGALMAWASKNTAEAAVELASQIITEGDQVRWESALDALIKSVGKDGTVKALTSRAGWKRDEAASLGTLVHALADDHINGRISEVPDHAKAHVKGYEEWWKASGWSVRTSEAYVLHPDHGYGGTLDLLCYGPGASHGPRRYQDGPERLRVGRPTADVLRGREAHPDPGRGPVPRCRRSTVTSSSM